MTAEPDVILINGPSSSGKSSVIEALRPMLERPYFVMSSDLLVDGGALPDLEGGYGLNTEWQSLRPAFFDGFHRAVAAMAHSGNPLIVEHVLEQEDWYEDCVRLLDGLDVLWIGVTAEADTLDERERARGDRSPGEGRSHLEGGVHDAVNYDLFLDTSDRTPAEVASQIASAVRRRSRSSQRG